MDSLLDLLEKFVGLRLPDRFEGCFPQVQIKAIETFPHFGGDLVANLTSIFTSQGHTAFNAETMGPGVKSQPPSNFPRFRCKRVFFGNRKLQSPQKPLPSGSHKLMLFIKHSLKIHIEQSSRMFSSLEVPAHPIKAVGHPG
jgi:hypothetical protein